MKTATATVTVTAGSKKNPVTAQVLMDDPLTPDTARLAARMAFGHTLGVRVTDGSIGYTLNGDKARKFVVKE